MIDYWLLLDMQAPKYSVKYDTRRPLINRSNSTEQEPSLLHYLGEGIPGNTRSDFLFFSPKSSFPPTAYSLRFTKVRY